MSLKFAILGFLTLEPMSGYTLKTQYFDQSVANFWPADQAQIYRTLYRLEEEGLIESTEIQQSDKPNRKPYHLTMDGMTALLGWLQIPQKPAAERFPFLIQLYFSRHLERDALIQRLDHEIQSHRAKLSLYECIVIPPATNEVMRRQTKFGAYTLDFGKRFETMQLEWLQCVKDDILNQ